MPDRAGLDIGYDSAVISCLLREGEGRWTTAVDMEKTSGDSIQRLVGERVVEVKGGKLPFDKESFDCVVIVGMLERLEDDRGFLKECHRVIRPAGRILIDVPRVKRVCPIRLLRNLFGLSGAERGQVRLGYGEKQLYKLVTDGFDIESSRTYSGFFVELADTFAQLAVKLAGAASEKASGFDPMRNKIYSLFYPFSLLGAQLDKLLFFTRGHSLLIRARRRSWNPRKVPVLRDGRSIADAALNYRIGSANPY